MDKGVVFAVAGSGKTRLIIEGLSEASRVLIISYTNSNISNIRRRIIEKFGYLPPNIKIYSYFVFLYNFCFKPLLSYKYKPRGILHEPNPNRLLTMKNPLYWRNTNCRFYANRLAKLVLSEVKQELKARLEDFFDEIYIDEIQDFSGNDFNLLEVFGALDRKVILVGDFYQYTYDTSRDAQTNANLHKDYTAYQNRFRTFGFEVDTDTLSKSWRCSPATCSFISNNIGINISSLKSNDLSEVIHLTEEIEITRIIKNPQIVKLFYDKHHVNNCYSNNWGASKGEDHYNDVCVVMNGKTYEYFIANKLRDLPSQTLSKLYVACTRTRGNLYLVSQQNIHKILI